MGNRSNSSTTSARRSEQNERSEGNSAQRGYVPLLIFGAASLFAVAIWLSLDTRRAVLGFLLIPDVIFLQWLGNDPSRFGLLDRIPLLLVSSCILAVSFLVGRQLLDLLRVGSILSVGESSVFSLAVGLNLVSLTTLGFGLVGQMHRWWFVVFAVLSVCGAVVRGRTWIGHAPPNDQGNDQGKPTRWTRVALGITAIFAILIVFGGMVPPWYFDVREYHLQVPKEWYRQGYIDFLPHNVYGNMPLGVELHSLLGMILIGGPRGWWWGALAGKTLIACLAPVAAWATYLFGRRFFDRRSSAIGAVIFISTPWVAHVSMAGLIDVAAALYCITSVHVALLLGQAKAGSSHGGESLGLAALSGWLAGAGIACKYPAVLFLVAPLFAWILLQRFPRFAWQAAAVFLIGASLACGPWLAKNYVLTGNPTYPLLVKYFGGKTRTPAKDEQWNRAHTGEGQRFRDRFNVRELANAFSLMTWSSDYVSPLAFPLAVVGLFASRFRRVIGPIVALCVYVVLMWWVLTHRLDRFLLPILPFASLLAGVGATQFSTPAWNRGIGVLVATGVVCCLCLVCSRYLGDNRFLVALEDLRLDISHPKDQEYFQVHSAHRFLNEAVRPGNQALMVGEAQVFNLEVPILYNTCFDDCQFELLMKGKTREQRYETLREHRISHMMVYWFELDRYRSPGNYGYSSYVTRDLVRRELCHEQGLFRRVLGQEDFERYELFEVVGWEEWE